MKQGVLIFALGSGDIDYVSIAAWNANRIARHLDLPVSLVTDQTSVSGPFDQVIVIEKISAQEQRWFEDLGSTTAWNNLGRCDAFDLSPYDRTLLLDADYVISSDVLRPVIDSAGFWCFRDAITPGASPNWEYFGKQKHPQYWATAVAFSKDTHSEMIFDIMRMIQQHWPHYLNLYQIDSTLFRNDYALSMAVTIANGHVEPVVPRSSSMLTVLPEQRLQQIDQDRFEVEYDTPRGTRRCTLDSQDFHAMCKHNLEKLIEAH
jgi:hypothetical protein